MIDPKLRAEAALLSREFSNACGTLARIAALPEERRAGLEETFTRFEDAAIALSRTEAGLHNRETWACIAARSLSLRLLHSFSADTRVSMSPSESDEAFDGVVRRASPAYLEALASMGVDLRSLHLTLMKRALATHGADIQPFLEARIATLLGWTDFLRGASNRSLEAHASFLARYLEAARAHHPDRLRDWNLQATRALNGRDMMIYKALGIDLPKDEVIIDHARHAFENHSAHRRMQIAAWTRDLEGLLRSPEALVWAADHLVQIPE